MPAWATRSRSASERALTGDELHLLRWGLGGVLALWSAWGVFFFELEGALLLPFITVAVLAVLFRPELPERVPAWAWRLVVPGLVGFVAIDLMRGGDPLAALVRLNLLLIAVRAVGSRRRREDLQLVLLCLFLVVAAGVLTVALGFVLHVVVFAGLSLAYLLTITLGAAAEPETADATGWRRIPWRRLWVRVRESVDWRVVVAGCGLYLLLVVGATTLFIAMPRFQLENSLGFLQLKNKRSLTGFSEVVKLGDVTEIAQDTATALRVELSGAVDAPGSPYWRMLALDEYRDGTFRASRGMLQFDRRIPETRTFVGEGRAAPDAPVWTFYFEAGISRFVPLPGEFSLLRLREARALVVNRRAGTLALREEPQAMFAYRLESVDEAVEPRDPPLAGEAWRRAGATDAVFPRTLLGVPEGAANAAALDAVLAEITGGERLPAAEFRRRAVEWLGRKHAYSLTSRVAAGTEDVLVRWMRGTGPGHCELFAGSFVLLARRAGFPARLVVGFRGGAWNGFEQYYMVRNSDAHAWCEILGEDGRWLRADPTPASRASLATEAVAPGREAAGDRSWAARVDALRMLWYRRIVNFDRGTQEEMTAVLREEASRQGQRLVAAIDRVGRAVRDWFLSPWGIGRLAVWAGVGAALAAVAWLVWRWRLLWMPRLRPGAKRDPIRREAGRWLRRFAQTEGNEEGDAVVRELQRLRYGPVEGRAGAPQVFMRARRAWRRRPRGR